MCTSDFVCIKDVCKKGGGMRR